MTFRVSCASCGASVAADDSRPTCATCGGVLRYEYDLTDVRFDGDSMWRYRDLMPVERDVEPVTLGEGGTPLVHARVDAGCRLWWKNEAANPTGSQKDRAMSVALTRARATGIDTVFVASAGSTALAAAAYAARAGLRCVVLVGDDATDRRLLPIAAYGARVLRVHGSVDDALELLDEAAPAIGIHDVSTRRAGNPAGAEGPKTIAYEILEALGHSPDWIVVPAGGGGTLGAIHRGFVELVAMGMADAVPRFASFQPAGYDTFPIALDKGWRTDDELRANALRGRPPTVQVKIAHSYAPDGAEALAAIRDSGGTAVSVTDAEALAGVAELASVDGIFAEPSSGGVVAAVRGLVSDEHIDRDAEVVGIIGGSGFREVDTLAATATPEFGFVPRDERVEFLAALASRR